MEEKNQKELLERPIPGLTAKQLLIIAGFFAGCITGYVDIKNGILDNRKQNAVTIGLMNEIKEEFKPDRKLDDARLHLIELQISECKTRISIMEKFVEGYNKQK